MKVRENIDGTMTLEWPSEDWRFRRLLKSHVAKCETCEVLGDSRRCSVANEIVETYLMILTVRSGSEGKR